MVLYNTDEFKGLLGKAKTENNYTAIPHSKLVFSSYKKIPIHCV